MKAMLTAALLAVAVAPLPAAPAGDALTDAERDAMLAALDDERRARSAYAAVLERHADVRPFSNVIRAERRHIDHLTELFERYGVEVPPDASAESTAEAPDTVRDACRAAVEAEIENAALYDELLARATRSDVRDVFTRLRDASRERHRPAFERCAAGTGGRGPERGGEARGGHGRGGGRGGQSGRRGPGHCMNRG